MRIRKSSLAISLTARKMRHSKTSINYRWQHYLGAISLQHSFCKCRVIDPFFVYISPTCCKPYSKWASSGKSQSTGKSSWLAIPCRIVSNQQVGDIHNAPKASGSLPCAIFILSLHEWMNAGNTCRYNHTLDILFGQGTDRDNLIWWRVAGSSNLSLPCGSNKSGNNRVYNFK